MEPQNHKLVTRDSAQVRICVFVVESHFERHFAVSGAGVTAVAINVELGYQASGSQGLVHAIEQRNGVWVFGFQLLWGTEPRPERQDPSSDWWGNTNSLGSHNIFQSQ